MPYLQPADVQIRSHAVLRRWGAPESVATCVSEHLADSDHSGHPSHGARQMLRYRGLVEQGSMNATVEPQIVHRQGALVQIDAQGGFGHPALALAVDTAVALAAEHGVGLASVVRCGHAGRMGAWSDRGAAHGMATIVLLAENSGPLLVAAGPGAVGAMQTNPISVGVPAEGDAIVLDMATSAIAAGKIDVARSRGQQVPEGAILDRDGRPTTDPNDFFAGGSMLPAAGHKGFGLSTVIEAMSIGLTGADVAGAMPRSGAIVICFPAGAFRPEAEARAAVERRRERLHASSRDRGVLVAGEPESRSRQAETIWVDDDVLALLTEPVAP